MRYSFIEMSLLFVRHKEITILVISDKFDGKTSIVKQQFHFKVFRHHIVLHNRPGFTVYIIDLIKFNKMENYNLSIRHEQVIKSA